jgi:hypothetical protein
MKPVKKAKYFAMAGIQKYANTAHGFLPINFANEKSL